MYYRFIFSTLVFLACQGLYAAGPACFNYEVYEHPTAGGILNRALTEYRYPQIVAQNAVIPVLGALAPAGGAIHQIGISLSQLAVPGWQDHGLYNLGVALNVQESCIMALTRLDIGIKVEFAALPAIAAAAAGGPVAPGVVDALRAGGYRAPLATAIYRLRNNLPAPNFLLMALPALPPDGAPVAPIADQVIIHIHNQKRVSKNMKELSYNSLAIPPVVAGAAPYLSIKGIIDGQFAVLGLPAPHSGLIVSSDNLQRD